MPYCSKCGKELEEGAAFCPQCGAPVKPTKIIYRNEPNRGIGKVLAFIFGGIILLVAFGLFMGGGVLMWGQGMITDSNGFINSHPVILHVDSYAIVQDNIDIHMDINMMRWSPIRQDIVTLKLTGNSNNPSKQVFIGIATAADAAAYLNDVKYDRLASYSWRFERDLETSTPTYILHQGGAPSVTPTSKNIWVTSIYGSGTQTLTWVPVSGEYWVIAMNTDGTPNVNVTMQIGAKIPILSTIGNWLIFAAILTMLIGAAVIYFGGLKPS